MLIITIHFIAKPFFSLETQFIMVINTTLLFCDYMVKLAHLISNDLVMKSLYLF